jgi:hypothetical protein
VHSCWLFILSSSLPWIYLTALFVNILEKWTLSYTCAPHAVELSWFVCPFFLLPCVSILLLLLLGATVHVEPWPPSEFCVSIVILFRCVSDLWLSCDYASSGTLLLFFSLMHSWALGLTPYVWPFYEVVPYSVPYLMWVVLLACVCPIQLYLKMWAGPSG